MTPFNDHYTFMQEILLRTLSLLSQFILTSFHVNIIISLSLYY